MSVQGRCDQDMEGLFVVCCDGLVVVVPRQFNPEPGLDELVIQLRRVPGACFLV